MKKTLKIKLILMLLISMLLLITYKTYQKLKANQLPSTTTSVSYVQRYVDKNVSDSTEAINLIKHDSAIQEKNVTQLFEW